MSGALVSLTMDILWFARSCGVGGRSEIAVSAIFEVGDRFSSYSEPGRVHNRVDLPNARQN